jgi:hypothetical protein
MSTPDVDDNITGQLVDAGIPVGLATKIGALVAAAFGVVAGVTAVLHGDHTEETITSLVLAAATVWWLMKGRYDQATARASAPQTLAIGEVGELSTPPAKPRRRTSARS